jgi:hypothetical protein
MEAVTASTRRAHYKMCSAWCIVWLADGTYALSSPFALGPQDSGNNGHQVIFRNVAGATPILSGGTALSNWTLVDADNYIYSTNLGQGTKTRQLYVDGERATRAKGPLNPSGFIKTATGWVTTDTSMLTWGNPSDVEIVSRRGWTEFRCPVASITSGAWQDLVATSTGTAFNAPVSWSLPFTSQGQGYYIGDFDGNGLSDVLFPHVDGNGRWHFDVGFAQAGGTFKWSGTWTLQQESTLSCTPESTVLKVGKFDNNALSDLLFHCTDAGGNWHNFVAVSTGAGFQVTDDWLPG